MKRISTKCFSEKKFHKASKIYRRIDRCFKQKDFRSNFCEEDDSTTDYRDALETLSQLQLTNFTNMALVALKEKRFPDAVQCC